MPTQYQPSNGVSFSRREFLSGVSKTSVMGAVLLSVGGGIAWFSAASTGRHPSKNHKNLRANDVALYTAVLPAVIPSAKDSADIAAFLDSLDELYTPLTPATKSQLHKMVDALTSFGTRQWLTRSFNNWSEMSVGEIDQLLRRWQRSETQLENAIYAAVTGLIVLAWYIQPSNQAESGYPGPPQKIVNGVNLSPKIGITR